MLEKMTWAKEKSFFAGEARDRSQYMIHQVKTIWKISTFDWRGKRSLRL